MHSRCHFGARTHRGVEHDPFSIVTDEALSDSQFGSGSGFSETGAGISPGRDASPGHTTVSAVRLGTPGLGGTSPGAGNLSGTKGATLPDMRTVWSMCPARFTVGS